MKQQRRMADSPSFDKFLPITLNKINSLKIDTLGVDQLVTKGNKEVGD